MIRSIKKKLKQKVKSLGNNFLKNNKKYEQKDTSTPKKRINFNFNYKLKADDNFKSSQQNRKSYIPKTLKEKRKVSFFESNSENKKKRNIFSEDKKEINIINKKKKSIFCKDRDKEKLFCKVIEKEKEKKNKNKKTKKNKEDKEKINKKETQNSEKPYRRDKSFTIIQFIFLFFISSKSLVNDGLLKSVPVKPSSIYIS